MARIVGAALGLCACAADACGEQEAAAPHKANAKLEWTFMGTKVYVICGLSTIARTNSVLEAVQIPAVAVLVAALRASHDLRKAAFASRALHRREANDDVP